jgi:hypothetical protein
MEGPKSEQRFIQRCPHLQQINAVGNMSMSPQTSSPSLSSIRLPSSLSKLTLDAPQAQHRQLASLALSPTSLSVSSAASSPVLGSLRAFNGANGRRTPTYKSNKENIGTSPLRSHGNHINASTKWSTTAASLINGSESSMERVKGSSSVGGSSHNTPRDQSRRREASHHHILQAALGSLNSFVSISDDSEADKVLPCISNDEESTEYVRNQWHSLRYQWKAREMENKNTILEANALRLREEERVKDLKRLLDDTQVELARVMIVKDAAINKIDCEAKLLADADNTRARNNTLMQELEEERQARKKLQSLLSALTHGDKVAGFKALQLDARASGYLELEQLISKLRNEIDILHQDKKEIYKDKVLVQTENKKLVAEIFRLNDLRSKCEVPRVRDTALTRRGPPVAAIATPPLWVVDESRVACHECSKRFTFFTRRHHCRGCGEVFCRACSTARVPLPSFGINAKVRVCNICNELYKQAIFSASSSSSSLSYSSGSSL